MENSFDFRDSVRSTSFVTIGSMFSKLLAVESLELK